MTTITKCWLVQHASYAQPFMVFDTEQAAQEYADAFKASQPKVDDAAYPVVRRGLFVADTRTQVERELDAITEGDEWDGK